MARKTPHMLDLERSWTVYLIHHSHLDVGYTHTPQEIVFRYNRFIDDLLDEFDRIESGSSKHAGYCYTVECFWILEQFCRFASVNQIERLKRAISSGLIEISASYLNFTDILDAQVYGDLVDRAKEFAASCGTKLDSAIISDVNGLNMTYALALSERGIRNLFTNVHSGHGMYALGRKLTPYRWLLPNGKSLLVYNGELYTFGNEFGFSPRGSFSDVMDDHDYQAKAWNKGPVDGSRQRSDEWLDLPRKRFTELFGHLEQVNHPYNYVAMGIHGTDDDNAIPNPEIIDRINQWNQVYGEQIKVKLVTLTEFFNQIGDDESIETVSGDWADWWSDGVGTAPWHLRYFKRLQTEYLLLKELDPELVESRKQEIETTLALFAEHTFGHFLSIADPWLDDSGSIQLVKEAQVGKLIELIGTLQQQYLAKQGSTHNQICISNQFTLFNPCQIDCIETIPLRFDKYDLYTYQPPYKITDSEGRVYPYFLKHIPELRAEMPHVRVKLKSSEKAVLSVMPIADQSHEIQLNEQAFHAQAGVGYDRIYDLDLRSRPEVVYSFDRVMMAENRATCGSIEIKWSHRGIEQILDQSSGTSLLNGREALGSPIFEVMKASIGSISPDSEANRRYQTISRNKKTLCTDRFFGTLDRVDLLEDTPWSFDLLFEFKIPFFNKYRLVLKVDKELKRIDMTVDILQQLVETGHNLYIPLPFTTKENVVRIDRGGQMVEAWREQLPGSLTDYTTVYGGIEVEREDLAIRVACPDAYLIQLKHYRYEPVVLMCENIRSLKDFDLYSWPISCSWACNFFARSSQQFRLRYRIEWGEKYTDQKTLEFFRQASVGLTQYKS